MVSSGWNFFVLFFFSRAGSTGFFAAFRRVLSVIISRRRGLLYLFQVFTVSKL